MASEVKGSWFVSLRACLEERDPEVLDRILRVLPTEHREALADPIASHWYPEQALAETLRAVNEVLARGDRRAFVDAMDAFTEVGVNRFFRVMLRLSSVRFVLRQVPTMWRQIRRGDGRVDVVDVPGGIEVRYTEFPYFADPLYEDLTVGSLRAVVRVCVGRATEVTVTHRGPDSLSVRIPVVGVD